MFLRSSVVKKGGKTYRYWKLVENVRTETGPRQRVVAHLGDLSNFTAGDWQDLAGRMGEPEMAAALQRRVRQSGRSGRPPKWTLADRAGSASDASDVVSIRLSATSWREPVAFGDVYTALVLWKRLGLGELLGERMNGSAAKVPWPTVAALIAVNRLVEPMPEWPMVRWWQRTALPQLLGIPLAAINDDRLYRCLDLVLPHKQAIEERIAGVGQSFFGQSYRYLLYDLTSTYFEGQMESNPKARRGYSRDHRPDCQQVTIGAVVDREGYPVGYEVLAGNVRDHQTVAGMLDRLGARFGLADRTLCMDRGMVTQDSLQRIRESTIRYVLADRRGASERFQEQVRQGPWQTRRADPDTGEAVVEVQEVGEEEGDRLILVRSRGCAQKEKGIHDRMLCKLKAHWERLQSTVRQGRLVNPEKIDRRIGSILARHPGMASWVCVRREELPAAESPAAAPGSALARPAGDRRTGPATGRRVPASHQRGRNRRGAGLGGLRDAGARGERVSHAEARSGVASGLPSPGGACRSPCLVLLDRLRDVLDAGADASSTRRIAEWPPRVGGVAWHPNGNDLFAKSGWDEAGTGESQYSPIRRSDGPALAERCAAATPHWLGPSGSDTSRGADPIRAGRRL